MTCKQGRRIRGLRVREHPLNMDVHPLTAKNTPSKWKENLRKHQFKQIGIQQTVGGFDVHITFMSV